MRRHQFSWKTILVVQALFLGAFAVGFAALNEQNTRKLEKLVTRVDANPHIPLPRREPLTITPLYDDPSVVTDDELAAVLMKIRPKFPASQRKPNYVEHALRAWGQSAEFQDPAVMSGADLRDFLVDHSQYAASWSLAGNGHDVEPILIEELHGIDVRWGSRSELSVHHDHMLACLAEAGVTLDERVFTPSGKHHDVADVLQQALQDFRLDERETEWSTLAFALYLPPTREFRTATDRRIDFDMLARRLIRGQRQLGVCSGTHRVYSLMVLWRLDQDFDILSDAVETEVWQHLEGVRDSIIASQYPDGRWPTNWPDGAKALTNPDPNSVEYREVIATGHHLEWLAIAPLELHPPREQVRKAAQWLIANTAGKTEVEIRQKYTFYSHVGNALALWRNTHPAVFWKSWQSRPDAPAIAE